MTLTITLPESVAKRAASWTPQELALVAVEAIAKEVREFENLTELFDENGESLGFTGSVPEEYPPIDAATIAEIKDDIANGRHYSLEEVDQRLDALFAESKATRLNR